VGPRRNKQAFQRLMAGIAWADPANQDVVRLQVIAKFSDYYDDDDKDIALAALRHQYADNTAVTLMFICSP
jgi:hypothetical protein